jgi:hypothetical protein
LRPAIAASIGATVLPALIGVWLWQTGVLAEAKIAIIDFNRYYVVDGFNFTEYPRLFADRVFLRFKTEPLWLVGVAGSLVAVWNVIRRRPLDPWPLLGLLWGAAAVAVIAVNGMRLFNSYFVQALAPLSLVAGWWLTTWWAQGRLTRAIVITAMAVSAVLLVQRNYIPKIVGDIAADTADLTGRGNHQAYLERFGGYENGRGYSARAHEELADYIRAHTAPNDRVFLFGINGAGVYFLAERLTVHRFLRVNFFLEGFPDPRFTLGAVTADLRARRPVYVMFERLHSESAMARQVDALQEDPLVRALLENYALETRIEDFTLYRLRADR